MPDDYGYKFLSQELTRWRMKVVDENMSIRAIEDKVSAGLIEELIFQAHNEIKLLRIMKNWKPWTYLMVDETDKTMMNDLMNVTSGQPFANNFETPEDGKHTGVPRRPSAALHPEDK